MNCAELTVPFTHFASKKNADGDKHQKLSQEEFHLCQCSMTSPVTEKTTKMNAKKNAESVKTYAGRFGIGQWSFIGPGSEKKWYSSENSPQGAWDHVAEDMLLKFAESGHPIFRSTTPLSRGRLKSKGKGKVTMHFSADQDTIDTIFRIILSVNQLSVCGAATVLASTQDSTEGRSWRPSSVEGALWLRVPTGSAHWLEGSLIPCTSSRRMGCKRSSSWGSSKPRS